MMLNLAVRLSTFGRAMFYGGCGVAKLLCAAGVSTWLRSTALILEDSGFGIDNAQIARGFDTP